MGIEAIIGSAIGIGGGLLSSRAQRRASRDALRAQTQASDANLALQREIYADQTRRLEPFRQMELQQANAYGEIFGFNPVGDGMAGAPSAPAGFTRADGTVATGQDAARSRFNESLFNDVYRTGHQRDTTRIDAGLASQGLAFSGARMQAVEDARADRFASTFNSYLAALMGSPPRGATESQGNAAGAFGANAGQIIQGQGDNAARSAYGRGQASADFWGSVAGLGGYMAGGGFSRRSELPVLPNEVINGRIAGARVLDGWGR